MTAADPIELLQLCDSFMHNQDAPPQILDALRCFVTTEPKALIRQTLFAEDDIEERKLLAERVQWSVDAADDIEDVIGPMFWSLLMTAPIHQLRWFVEMCKPPHINPPRINFAEMVTTHLGFLLKTFLSKEFEKTDTSPYATCNVTEAEKCRLRDGGSCVLTGSASPTVCHIVPFSVTKRKQGTLTTIKFVIAQFWGLERSKRLNAFLSQDSNIDCVKNMVCLEPLLHHWWGKAYFALEPVEKVPKGTRVCLQWLPRTKLSVHGRLPLNSDPRNYMTPPEEPGVVGMRDFVSGHPLLDGAMFDLTSETSETKVSFDMLELQWDLLRMAALCGAVNAADDPNWNPGEDDPSLNPGLFDNLSHD